MPSNTVEQQKKPNPAGTSIQCLERAMAILNLLAERSDCRVTDLARDVGLNVTTAHNILRTLTVGGYTINLNGRYSIGPAAVRLAFRYSPLVSLPQLVAPAMSEMSESCGEAGFLGAMVAQRLEMISVSHGTDEVTVQGRRNRYEHPMVVACGRLLVAYEREGVIEPTIAAHVSARQDRTTEFWREELARIREDRCVVLRRPGGADAVAVPLYGPDGHIVAALGASCPHYRGTAAHLLLMLESLATAATSAHTQQGWSEEPVKPGHFRRAIARAIDESMEGAPPRQGTQK